MSQSFSLVSTVLNPGKNLSLTLETLANQTQLPKEIVIVDAGSTDGSFEILKNWKWRDVKIILISELRCNVAKGRNIAIHHANTDIIVSMDFGCYFKSDWIESLVKPLVNGSHEVVGGQFAVDKDDINTIARRSDYLLQKGYNYKMDENFSVSSRSIAFRKYVWEKIGGYPEWLTLAADDTIFWKLVKRYGFRYEFVERPLVYWMRHNTNRGFAKEAGRYGLGDGESRINYRNFLSNLLETCLRYLFFVVLMGLPYLIHKYPLYPALLFLTLPGLRSYYGATRNWIRMRSSEYNLPVLLNAFLQIELSRFSYLKGYIKGMLDPDPKKAEGRRQLWSVLK